MRIQRFAIGAIIIVLALLMLGISTAGVLARGDMSANSVIKGGVFTIGDLRNAYDSDRTPGTKDIFSYFGLSSETIHSGRVVNGTVTKSGDVLVGGKAIATQAVTAGRVDMPGSTKVTHGKTTFYMRTPAVSFQSDSLAAYIFTEADGTFLGAVIKDCGNPVKAAPTTKPPAPLYSCDTLTATAINRMHYRFTAKATAENGAKITGYTFTFGDGKNIKSSEASQTHMYSRSGSYDVSVTVHFNVDGTTYSDSTGCTITIDISPEPSAACVNLTLQRISRDKVTFIAHARTKNGASVQAYMFSLVSDDATVATKRVDTSRTEAESGTMTLKPGKYTARVVVKTTVGDVKSDACVAQFSVSEKEHPPQPEEKPPAVTTVNEEKNQVTPESEAPAELPYTGPVEVVGGIVGLGSLTAAAYYYAAVRRQL
jgi:hypothetical protein